MITLFSIHGAVWHILERYLYKLPPRPPRKRSKPMEVLCVGFPRTGTESLQHALLALGYDYTYHGFDIIFEEPNYASEWVKLARKKFSPTVDVTGDCDITAEDFDRIIGHCTAVTDAAGSCFASELIRAYPKAKVVLNTRTNLDGWRQSALDTIAMPERTWTPWLLSWWAKDIFWVYHAYYRLLWPALFRCLDGSVDTAIRKSGIWIHREHCDMVRGMVPKENLLEFSMEDGWEPLCKFLGKEIPEVQFPRTNTAAGYDGRIEQVMKLWVTKSIQNILITLSVATLLAGVLWWTR